MLPRGLVEKNNELYINKYSFKELQKEYGTPLYIYDKKELMTNIDIFNQYFKGKNFESQVVYASKAFLVPKMCEIISEHNWMIDAVSLGDLYIIDNSMDIKKAVFHGNNKSMEELRFAVEKEVGIIVVDNYEELITIGMLAKEYKKVVKTMFRVNPGIEAHTHSYIQTSLLSSKFGESIYDEEVLSKIMNFYVNNKQVELLGFHSHIGSQITEKDAFLKNAEVMVDFTLKMEKMYNYPIKELNLGGGFGITYTNEEVDLKEILQAFVNKLDELVASTNIKKVYIEPGRSIVGRSGMTLYTGSMIKNTFGGKKYLFVDGGMTDNIRPALYQAVYEVLNPVNLNGEKTLVDVVGKCCESGDIVSKDIKIAFSKGDPILVLSTGAYGYSMSSNYNSALKAKVILVDDNIEVISRKEELQDLMRLYK
ncbi:MAG: diaminopimelate decarboxylase [Bacilli bacterium]|nr:diaminopimelate decarboxylase [Bacilli bacterium]